MAMSDRDTVADALRRFLPPKLAHGIARWKNVMIAMAVFNLFKRKPELARRTLIDKISKRLPDGFPVDPHFAPKYNVFDQRMLLVPNGDMFQAIADGRVDVVTDQIETITEKGIELKSGGFLAADIIVTATGLQLQFAGNIEFSIDGEVVPLKDRIAYKATMLDGVPNLAFCFGYSNAPWTLRADQSAKYVSRLISHMDRHGYVVAAPRLTAPPELVRPLLNLQSGYVKRGDDVMPKQGADGPWFLRQNYALDVVTTKFGDISDSMQFSTTPVRVSAWPQRAEAAHHG
jgi:cation diffusion facilitator CzcD-associated flavoprotein CzcO